MQRIEEIEAAIERLEPDEFQRFAQWFYERDQQRWDEKLDCDASSGTLKFLFDEADGDATSTLREWPPAS